MFSHTLKKIPNSQSWSEFVDLFATKATLKILLWKPQYPRSLPWGLSARTVKLLRINLPLKWFAEKSCLSSPETDGSPERSRFLRNMCNSIQVLLGNHILSYIVEHSNINLPKEQYQNLLTNCVFFSLSSNSSEICNISGFNMRVIGVVSVLLAFSPALKTPFKSRTNQNQRIHNVVLPPSQMTRTNHHHHNHHFNQTDPTNHLMSSIPSSNS